MIKKNLEDTYVKIRSEMFSLGVHWRVNRSLQNKTNIHVQECILSAILATFITHRKHDIYAFLMNSEDHVAWDRLERIYINTDKITTTFNKQVNNLTYRHKFGTVFGFLWVYSKRVWLQITHHFSINVIHIGTV